MGTREWSDRLHAEAEEGGRLASQCGHNELDAADTELQGACLGTVSLCLQARSRNNLLTSMRMKDCFWRKVEGLAVRVCFQV